MTDINVVKERVIEELKKQGIDVYFIDFYVDDGGKPYFVYTFDVDYNNGDKILMQDTVLGLQVAGRITNVVYTYGKTNRLTLTFGYSQPSFIERLKQSL